MLVVKATSQVPSSLEQMHSALCFNGVCSWKTSVLYSPNSHCLDLVAYIWFLGCFLHADFVHRGSLKLWMQKPVMWSSGVLLCKTSFLFCCFFLVVNSFLFSPGRILLITSILNSALLGREGSFITV